MRINKWLLVAVVCVASSSRPAISQTSGPRDATSLVGSPGFGNRLTPSGYRRSKESKVPTTQPPLLAPSSKEEGEDDEEGGPQVEQPRLQPEHRGDDSPKLQDRPPSNLAISSQDYGNQSPYQQGFGNQIPRYNYQPYYSNFNRPGYNIGQTPFGLTGTSDLDFRAPFPQQYDDGFGIFGSGPGYSPRGYHVRRGYQDGGCRNSKDERSQSERPPGAGQERLSPEQNFHQRYDPGPDGFQDLGSQQGNAGPFRGLQVGFSREDSRAPAVFNSQERRDGSRRAPVEQGSEQGQRSSAPGDDFTSQEPRDGRRESPHVQGSPNGFIIRSRDGSRGPSIGQGSSQGHRVPQRHESTEQGDFSSEKSSVQGSPNYHLRSRDHRRPQNHESTEQEDFFSQQLRDGNREQGSSGFLPSSRDGSRRVQPVSLVLQEPRDVDRGQGSSESSGEHLPRSRDTTRESQRPAESSEHLPQSRGTMREPQKAAESSEHLSQSRDTVREPQKAPGEPRRFDGEREDVAASTEDTETRGKDEETSAREAPAARDQYTRRGGGGGSSSRPALRPARQRQYNNQP